MMTNNYFQGPFKCFKNANKMCNKPVEQGRKNNQQTKEIEKLLTRGNLTHMSLCLR